MPEIDGFGPAGAGVSAPYLAGFLRYRVHRPMPAHALGAPDSIMRPSGRPESKLHQPAAPLTVALARELDCYGAAPIVIGQHPQR